MPPVLELRGITKTFPGVLANDHIDLTLEQGEIHVLLGENGAGKTTLMNVLYGLYSPDEGEIRVRGQRVEIREPRDAIAQGIGMVHQHFMLVPVFTVAENVMLGVEPIRSGMFLDRAAAARRIRDISGQYGLKVDPDAIVKSLPVGIQQRVEIVKLLYREADILILDEPTAVLTPQEAEDLFGIIRSLVAQGKSVIFITHKLKEVMAIADRITVLRNGRVAGVALPAQTSEEALATLMVGRQVLLRVDKGPSCPGEKVLEVKDLEVKDDRGNPAVRGVSFEVRAGEVLGIAGVQGNGQTELVQALTGLRRPAGGRVRILGNDASGKPPRWVLEQGTAHVPEDRQKDGLVLPFSVASNLALNTYYLPPFARPFSSRQRAPLWIAVGTFLGGLLGMLLAWDLGMGSVGSLLAIWGLSLAGGGLGGAIATLAILREGEIERAAQERVETFDIRTPSISTPVASLSGGNQQKVIVAREFSRPVRLLIASQPTRGLDVGSIEYIHRRIVEKRDEGCAVLLVSPELDEVMSLSDRIAVMYEGRIMDILPAERTTKEEIGLLMAGVRKGAVGANAA